MNEFPDIDIDYLPMVREHLKVVSEEVAAKTRKLKAVWTIEAQQDFDLCQIPIQPLPQPPPPITDPDHIKGVQAILAKYPWLKV